MEKTREFKSVEEEIQFLKCQAENFNERIKNLETELDEQLDQSACFEKELETSICQHDKISSGLEDDNYKLRIDTDKLITKLKNKRDENNYLQAKLKEQNQLVNELLEKIRSLENENDKFEKEIRKTKVGEEELEFQLETVLERLAIVDTELEEKEEYEIAIQSLKDENTELRRQNQVELRQTERDKFICLNLHPLDESNPNKKSDSSKIGSSDYVSNKCDAADLELLNIEEKLTTLNLNSEDDEFQANLSDLGEKFTDLEIKSEDEQLVGKVPIKDKDSEPKNGSKWKKNFSCIKSFRKSYTGGAALEFNKNGEEEKNPRILMIIKRLREVTGYNKQ